MRIGPIAPGQDSARTAVIGLHLEQGDSGERPGKDVHGTAWFADLWAGRLPRMTLTTSRADNVLIEPNRPTITCTAAGFSAAANSLRGL